MRSYRLLALLALICPTPVWAAAISDFFPNCAKPTASTGRTLTVNPQARGQGSYASLSAAIQAARPGDTVSLVTGEYGDLTLTGANQGDFITIAAGQGQTPRFTKVRISKPASRWKLSGLTVSGFSAKTEGYLLTVLGGDNIILERNKLNSQPGALAWKPYVANSPDTPSHGINARQSSCISIQDNEIRNVFHGMEFGGDQNGNNGKFFLVSGNTIDNFAGDGIEHYGSHVRILNNKITNGHNLCDDKCVHSDGIQGWNYNHQPLLNTDVVIDGNTIIAQTSRDLPLPVATLQGITIFDGKWDGVTISNNLVITTAYHGITVNRVKNGAIVNNTVAPINSGKMRPWIMANPDKQDPSFASVISRNNVVGGIIRPGTPDRPGTISDHNVGLKDAAAFAGAFIKFDQENFAFDMRPSRGSPVIGAGSREGAPAVDIEGKPRTGAIDAGAYQAK